MPHHLHMPTLFEGIGSLTVIAYFLATLMIHFTYIEINTQEIG